MYQLNWKCIFVKGRFLNLTSKFPLNTKKKKQLVEVFFLSRCRLWLRPVSNRHWIAVVEMQRSRGHCSQERMPCLAKHIVAWKSEEMLAGILIHRVYFEKSAWLSRSIHKVQDNVQGLSKMATRDYSVVAGQNGRGILVSLRLCLSWKMQSIPRAQRRFLEEKGNTGKQTAKILKCRLALKYFREESDFVCSICRRSNL